MTQTTLEEMQEMHFTKEGRTIIEDALDYWIDARSDDNSELTKLAKSLQTRFLL